ncbi:hypothetical protein HK099_004648 [Clydaea vesicula]|uniref:Uncharacterized protein n=1 Tax=Clydaea vesicula TaxID=447962 RepID=A0AAD5U1N6_9FUNG|nr:hypothetical protein HK099_004648 [Clydaea vesicula]KAJ3393690.1 hypothetical protein HDU92_007590 [Lobulomyces angularis]
MDHCQSQSVFITNEEQHLLETNNVNFAEVTSTFEYNSLDIGAISSSQSKQTLHIADDEATTSNHYQRKILERENNTKKTIEYFNVGLATAISISLHKLLEGFLVLTISTFYPSDSHFSFILFVALAVHNFAEGVAISVPIYMASKNMWKTFLVSLLLGGLSQPLGGLLGYLAIILGNWKTTGIMDDIFGITLSIICGMMLWIVFDGMLPIAQENRGIYSKRILSTGLFSGVAVMILTETLIIIATKE